MNTTEMAEKSQEWQETAENMTEQARNWQKQAAETARNLGRSADTYVRENPWYGVAIAAAVGCAIGLILGRSRD